jgi:cyclase
MRPEFASASEGEATLIDRRRLLTGAFFGAVALRAPAGHVAAAKEPLRVVELGSKLFLITGAGGNVVARTGADGVLLVDGGLAARSRELLRLVARLSRRKRIHTLFNTHWHWDHTGSNEAVHRAGATIIAHHFTRLWLGGDFYVEWENRPYRPRPPEALPSQTFRKRGELVFDGETIEYGHLPRAHTDGDIFVRFTGANVLVAGDTLSVGRYPLIDYSTGGWIGGMIDANRTLLGIADAGTRIIPGTGAPQVRADLQGQADMLAAVKQRLIAMMGKSFSTREMLEHGATREFDAQWGDPTQFVANAHKSLWAHSYALGLFGPA